MPFEQVPVGVIDCPASDGPVEVRVSPGTFVIDGEVTYTPAQVFHFPSVKLTPASRLIMPEVTMEVVRGPSRYDLIVGDWEP